MIPRANFFLSLTILIVGSTWISSALAQGDLPTPNPTPELSCSQLEYQCENIQKKIANLERSKGTLQRGLEKIEGLKQQIRARHEAALAKIDAKIAELQAALAALNVEPGTVSVAAQRIQKKIDRKVRAREKLVPKLERLLLSPERRRQRLLKSLGLVDAQLALLYPKRDDYCPRAEVCAQQVTPTATPSPIATNTPTPIPTATATPLPTPVPATPTATPTPAGIRCNPTVDPAGPSVSGLTVVVSPTHMEATVSWSTNVAADGIVNYVTGSVPIYPDPNHISDFSFKLSHSITFPVTHGQVNWWMIRVCSPNPGSRCNSVCDQQLVP
ncbi:MAG: hypothetical protein K1X83_13645 [Oligoflexia bacterium]|nr:hypothetical protein [Oligoflexia bacterium]